MGGAPGSPEINLINTLNTLIPECTAQQLFCHGQYFMHQSRPTVCREVCKLCPLPLANIPAFLHAGMALLRDFSRNAVEFRNIIIVLLRHVRHCVYCP